MYKMDDNQNERLYNDQDEWFYDCEAKPDCCGECDGEAQVDRIQLRAQIVAHLLPLYSNNVDDMLDDAKRLEYFILNGE